jgi:hypothetical protein
MLEIAYTQALVEKYLEKPCIGGRILVIKCQLMPRQCVGRLTVSESFSFAVRSEHCNKSLGLRGGEILNHILPLLRPQTDFSHELCWCFSAPEIKANFQWTR